MPKYETYRNSNIQWIGEIPTKWNLEKAKWLFYKAERKPLVDDEIVTCFRDGQVTLRKNRRIEGFTNALKEHGYQRICKGDLVIHAMDAFAGAIGVSDSDGKSTPVYAACIPREKGLVNSYYYAYYMRDLALSGFIESLAKGIRERSTDFRFNDFAELLLPLPSYEEQSLIVSFLDKKIAQIDDAIAIKGREIDLLKERKQIIVLKAVTQGLEPNVLMKDSGLDWIGKIPEHWELTKLGSCLSPVSIKNCPDLPLLSITRELGVIERDVEDQDSNHNFIPDDLSGYKKIEKGQFGMNKMKAWQGSYGVSKYTGIVSPAYFVFNFTKAIDPEFFNWAIRSKLYVSFFGSASDGVRIGQWDLSKDRMKAIPFILPSKEEQTQIANFLDKKNVQIDEAIVIKEQQIEKVKEYKKILINRVVTGKIKITPDMVEQ
ncbi:restriction endonuclease subunit S [Klebsiella michiganensis]|nr:restriction endonuclease subunit S [Klebsiella michiganensis]ELF4772227.1 restriction endonuclease subunit S [Klebsiella michiganensis]ELP0294369.1 restriction endonuclease subunit S [Klebsiella michiganensis]ELS4548718.1 restriction endonuclease subunit S [Klebsiella michiganensis]HBM2975394.1 restriction endonuclease subunit S [Klebsiella michiganensis]